MVFRPHAAVCGRSLDTHSSRLGLRLAVHPSVPGRFPYPHHVHARVPLYPPLSLVPAAASSVGTGGTLAALFTVTAGMACFPSPACAHQSGSRDLLFQQCRPATGASDGPLAGTHQSLKACATLPTAEFVDWHLHSYRILSTVDRVKENLSVAVPGAGASCTHRPFQRLTSRHSPLTARPKWEQLGCVPRLPRPKGSLWAGSLGQREPE
jgi:hypothetical protein